jgi:hypothetical protein
MSYGNEQDPIHAEDVKTRRTLAPLREARSALKLQTKILRASDSHRRRWAPGTEIILALRSRIYVKLGGGSHFGANSHSATQSVDRTGFSVVSLNDRRFCSSKKAAVLERYNLSIL